MAKKVKKISRPVKQKFNLGLFYLIFSLIVLILIAVFVNTSKISKEPKATSNNSKLLSTIKIVKYKQQLKNKTNYRLAQLSCLNKFSDKKYFSNYFVGAYDTTKIVP